ncbi:MAG: DNA translocase FtsK 4TM domain-containing protein, partial [Deltaproteobacteria bacterium]|nr:DNA translocase FtsK 4TM domain-containing protein [Deltaproteobacteria bacterium]
MAPTARIRREYRKELSAILFLALGVFFGLCLVSYDPADPALNVASNVQGVNNLGGLVGAYTADLLFTIFGVSAYLLVAILFLVSTLQFIGRQIHLSWRQAIGYAVVIAAAAGLLHVRFRSVHLAGQPIEAGGLLGGIVGGVLAHYLNTAGAYVIASALFCAAFMYASGLSVRTLLRAIRLTIVFLARHGSQWGVIYFHRLRRAIPKGWRGMRA